MPENTPPPPPPGYPAEWETYAVLSDGVPVQVRPIVPDDRDLLAAFHKRQSPESIYFRFFRPRPELSEAELDYFTQIDYRDRMAFVALVSDELVAVARYENAAGGEAPEVAFIVDDAHQGRGLATLLLEYLAAAARSHGLDRFTATVLPENHRMLRVFRQAGFGVSTRFADGVIDVDLAVSVTPESSSAIADRHTRSRAQSVARLLRPASVAVVGASRRPGSIGHELLRNIADGGFTGEVHAVNRAAGEEQVLGQPTWPSLTAIGRSVDLVLVAVPADEVAGVVADAAESGAGGLLVVSAGFSEAGPEGAEREQELVRAARSNGMRLIGPGAFGLVNTDPAVQLRALFLPILPAAGSVALLSQSGPLGSAVLEQMQAAGVGISSFVAVGNRADVSVNDLLQYWAVDDGTDAVLLYVENYGNLRNAAATMAAISAVKPVVAVRPPDDNVVELLAQSGVILVDGVSELADVARVAATEPLPAGRRVAVVSNTASVARLAVAACCRHGLEVVVPRAVGGPAAPATSTTAPEAVLVADADLTLTAAPRADSGPTDYERIVVATAASDEVDAVLVALVPTLEFSLGRLAGLLDGVSRSIGKPVVAAGLVGQDMLSVAGLPLFTFPEEAARSLGRLAAYGDWRRRLATDPPPTWSAGTDGAGEGDGVSTEQGESSVRAELIELLGDAARIDLSLWSVATARAVDLLDLPVARWRVVWSRTELTAASEPAYPVVLKASSDARRTVGEAGGAAIDLHGGAALEAAYDRMLAARGEAMLPAVVQEMLTATGMVKIDLVQDLDLGAFVEVALGGTAGLKLPALDRRYLPLTGADIEGLVTALATAITIDPAAEQVLRTMITRLGLLGIAVGELSLLSLDPVLLSGDRTAAVDLTITLQPSAADPLAEVRRI